MAFCSKCGNNIDDNAQFCSSCGAVVSGSVQVGTQQPQQSFNNTTIYPPGYEPKRWLTALLLCILLGSFHRFYVGKIGTGILMTILMLAALGFIAVGVPLIIGYFTWWLIDLILLCTGQFKDKRGFPLKRGKI